MPLNRTGVPGLAVLHQPTPQKKSSLVSVLKGLKEEEKKAPVLSYHDDVTHAFPFPSPCPLTIPLCRHRSAILSHPAHALTISKRISVHAFHFFADPSMVFHNSSLFPV